MIIKQISIFLENKSGRLSEVTKLLGDNNIDINALSLADTTNYGVLRLIVNYPENAVKILQANNYTFQETDVIAIAVKDKPGGLSEALSILNEINISIEYMYAFVGKKGDQALVILRVEDTESSIKILSEKGIDVLPSQELYQL